MGVGVGVGRGLWFPSSLQGSSFPVSSNLIISLTSFQAAAFIVNFSFLFFLRLYLFIFRERVREGEREGEKHQCVVASCMPSTGDLACNPGMCPDWGLNRQPFVSLASTQSTEPHQPGLTAKFS